MGFNEWTKISRSEDLNNYNNSDDLLNKPTITTYKRRREKNQVETIQVEGTSGDICCKVAHKYNHSKSEAA